ncbi:Vacuolar protein sorting-associated protein 9A [Diplonema papillatum]|nr:Vacuolar protein sorting-associated protein 9A [Diplonema papillatum]
MEAAEYFSERFDKLIRDDDIVQDMLINLQAELGDSWFLAQDKGAALPKGPEAVRLAVIIEDEAIGNLGLRNLDGEYGSYSMDKSRVVFKSSGDRKILHRVNRSVTAKLREIPLHLAVLESDDATLRRAMSADRFNTHQQQNTPGKEQGQKSFIAKMRDPKAMPLARAVKRFIAQVAARATDEAADQDEVQKELAARVDEFHEEIFKELQLNDLWVDAGAEELTHAKEGMRKYLLCKIHPHSFGKRAQTSAQDALLDRQLARFDTCPSAFLTPQSVHQHPRWPEAVEQLKKVNEFKSPVDKLVCISNSCRLMFMICQGKSPTPPTADELVRALRHVVFEAKVAQLPSNIEYTLQYEASKLDAASEDVVFLSSIAAAVDEWLNFSSFESHIAHHLSLAEPSTAAVPADLPAGGSRALPLACVGPLVEQTMALRRMEAALKKAVGLVQM